MRLRRPALLFAISFALVSLAAIPSIEAQESLLALGNVESDGSLGPSASPSGATISSAQLATGSYEVTLTLPGGFQGTTINDFVIEAGVEWATSSDVGINARIVSVSANTLVAGFRTHDLEDSSSVNNPVPVNRPFYFSLRRTPTGENSTEGDSRHLLAVGTIHTFLGIDNAFGVGGISVKFFREGTGHCEILLEKPGAFVDDDPEDYLIFLTSNSGDEEDEILRGDVKSTVLDSSVSLTIHNDDVQSNPAGNSGTPADGTFFFAIYRVDGAEASGSPASRCVVLSAAIGSDGFKDNGATSIPGGFVISNRDAAGDYDVFVSATGAFGGPNPDRFIPIVTTRGGLLDQVASAQVFITNADTLQIAVRTKDVQDSGQDEGVLSDNAFDIVVYTSEPEFAPDLGIGARNVPASFRTFGVRNATGAGQVATVRPRGTKRQRFFSASENVARSVDGLRLLQLGKTKGATTDYFRLTGGRANVSAAIRSGGLVAASVRPGDRVSFEGGIRYRKSDRPRPKTFRLRGSSVSAPGAIDVNQVRAVPR